MADSRALQAWLAAYLRGDDNRPVTPKGPPKSILEARSMTKAIAVAATEQMKGWVESLSYGGLVLCWCCACCGLCLASAPLVHGFAPLDSSPPTSRNVRLSVHGRVLLAWLRVDSSRGRFPCAAVHWQGGHGNSNPGRCKAAQPVAEESHCPLAAPGVSEGDLSVLRHASTDGRRGRAHVQNYRDHHGCDRAKHRAWSVPT